MADLRDLGPGDEVAIVTGRYSPRPPRIVRIERVTKAQIVTDGGARWRRDNGRGIPYARPYYFHIEPATDAHRHVAERVELLAVISRVFVGHDRYRFHRDLRTDTLRGIVERLNADPAVRRG